MQNSLCIEAKARLLQIIIHHLKFINNENVAYEFTGELERKERWQYPLPVLREILLKDDFFCFSH